MATTTGKSDLLAAIAPSFVTLSDPSDQHLGKPPDWPGKPPDRPPDRLSDPSPGKDSSSRCKPGSSKDSALDPTKVKEVTFGKSVSVKNLKVLHVQDLPAQSDYDTILKSFCSFGIITEIRMNFLETESRWEAWVTFNNHEDALKACSNINTVEVNEVTVRGALTDKAPKTMDSYKPSEWSQGLANQQNTTPTRTPKPPMWLIASAKGETYNYFRFCRYLQKRVGGIKSGDISRFGKGTVLIHAKSKTQAMMLSLLNVSKDDTIKEIRPHLTFSYGRGVIFDPDLYEFTESEILEMSPPSVWKVKKTAIANMMILTFDDVNVPSHVVFENERIRVKPFQPRPIQCFNCFKFGHPSRVCKNAKTCMNCAALEHGECSSNPKCVNCKLNHKANDKQCEVFKFEQSAINKANAEHTSIGYAKRELGKMKSYARALAPLPLTSTGGEVAAAPVVGASTPVVVAQPSGSGTQPVEVRVQSSKEDKMAYKKESSSIKTLSSSSTTLNTLAQAESLPDLMEAEEEKLQKRRRSPSSSPPIKSKYASLHNRYEVLSLDEDPQCQITKGSNKGQQKGHSKTSENKPNLSRPVMPISTLDRNKNRKSHEKTPIKEPSKSKK